MGLRLALLALLGVSMAVGQDCPATPTYGTCDLVFEMTAAEAAQHPNPYLTVTLHAEFRSPKHRTHTQPGFWDGGRRFVIRYAPVDPGQFDYRVTSNLASINGKSGAFNATDSGSSGFIQPDNVHAWSYTETKTAHLWMGDTVLNFATMDRAAFDALITARAAQNFSHIRGTILPPDGRKAFAGPDEPNPAWFQEVDRRVTAMSKKNIFLDLVLAGGANQLATMFPQYAQRDRLARFLVAHYSPMLITWQGVEAYEKYNDPRGLLKELYQLIQRYDPYKQPRSTGSLMTSAPLLSDGWMNYVTYGNDAPSLSGVERQILRAPLVQAGIAGDPASFTRRLWRATMNGQYPTAVLGDQDVEGPRAKTMSAWYNFFSQTRFWELEPNFEVENGYSLALSGVEYIVLLDKADAVQVVTERKGYQVYWVRPATGEIVKEKKDYKGELFVGQPPDYKSDWVLHLSRDGRKEGMLKSWKFESRPVFKQEVEANPAKIPFVIESPKEEVLPAGKPIPFRAKLTRETKASKSMQWVWTAEATADGEGYRVLATEQNGTFEIPLGIAKNFPAVVNLRLQGINANGKVYSLDRVIRVTK